MLQFISLPKQKPSQYIGISFNNQVFVVNLSKDTISELNVTEKNCFISHASFGLTENEIYTATTNKMIEIWENDNLDTNEWKFKSRVTFKKKPLKIEISEKKELAIVSDKFGTVFGFDMKDNSNRTLQSLLGHVSTVTDMILSPDENFLVTADHDEKIRITKFPETYDIHRFCLGHKEFVSKIAIVASTGILISASGDHTIRSWNMKDGTQTDQFDISTITSTNDVVSCLAVCPKSKRIVALIEGFQRIIVFALQDWPVGKLNVFQEIDLGCCPTSALIDTDENIFLLSCDIENPILSFSTLDTKFIRKKLKWPNIEKKISDALNRSDVKLIQEKFSLIQYKKKDFTKKKDDDTSNNNNNNLSKKKKKKNKNKNN